jgi:flagellin-specific chaperone FliS
MRRSRLFGAFLPSAVLLLLFCAAATCCFSANTTDVAVKSALNTLNDVVTPASKLAFQGCIKKQQVALDALADGGITATEAKADIVKTRNLCEELRAIFDQIRAAHSAATELYQAGNLDEAQARINQARNLFIDINNKLGGEL